MSFGDRYAAEWQNLKLVIQEQEHYWQSFVYDFENCDVLYTSKRRTIDSAKVAALDFVAAHCYGPGHDLNLNTIAEMLLWEPY